MISINSNFHCQLSCFHQGWKYFSFIYRTPILHLDGNTHFLELLKIKFCFARMGQHVRGHANIRVANKVASGVNIKFFFGVPVSVVNENSPTFCFLLVCHIACLKLHLLTSMIWLSVSCLICPSSVCSFSFSLILRWSSSLSSELLVELSPDVSALDRLQQKMSIKMQLDQQ